MYYVSCIDTFLSGWGESENMKNKIIFECETEDEMDKLVHKLKGRSDMKYVYKDTDNFPKRLLETGEIKTNDTYYQLKKASDWLKYGDD